MPLPPLAAYIDEFVRCNSMELVWAMHVKKMKDFGFDRMIFGSTRFRTDGKFGKLMDALVLTNHDKSYIDLFIGEEMYLYAPMAIWAANNSGSCSWQWAQDQRKNGRLTSDEEKCLEINERMGVTAGYSISFEAVSKRQKAAIGLCAQPGISQADLDDLWARSGPEIELLNNLLNLKLANLPNFGARKPMTKRQKETLQWVADGKTIQDVGVIMGLQPTTVEKHLRLARENLDVETTAQAILKASVQNQFFLLEDLGSGQNESNPASSFMAS